MAKLNLSTGDTVDLSGAITGSFSLGWDTLRTEGIACALLLNAQGKVPDNRYFIFDGPRESPDGSVKHVGDSVEADAVINVRLLDVPAEINRIIFLVSAAGADEHARLSSVFLYITDAERDMELARYRPSGDVLPGTVTAVGELYRSGAGWKFRAENQFFHAGLGKTVQGFGVEL